MSPNFHRARVLAAAIIASFTVLAGAQVASADNLLLLDSEHAVVSGNLNYGLVYVDGQLRITGDTSITAGSIYFGPDAQILTCDIEGSGPGTGQNACTQGRALSLNSPGPITVSSGLDLTAGAGTTRNAGSLSISGGSVAIGGDINVAGSGPGFSGNVSISSGGGLSIGAVNDPGGTVTLGATGAIDVGGDIQTPGTQNQPQVDPSRLQAGGPVTVTSSAGDVRINGNINAAGRDAPAAGGSGFAGGFGGPVTITGSDVRVGQIDSTGGTSQDNAAGLSSDIALTARGSLTILGRLDASGQGAPKSSASPGANITATAGGALVAGGGAASTGAQGAVGGTNGGKIVLQGDTVDAGPLSVAGGDAPNVNGISGGLGGTITVSGTNRATLGSVDAGGGDGANGGGAAPGGAISVTSTAGSIATGRVSNLGGNTGGGNGANGGTVSLSAQGNLTVGSVLDTSGSNANGQANPPRVGGSGGAIYLRAGTGVLTLGGSVRSTGGNGAQNSVGGADGGAGGNGGRIDVVAHAIGSVVSIFTGGGDGGGSNTSQGPGGAGGAIYSWSDATLFDDQKVVSTDGGMGQPTGASGPRQSEMSPTGVTIDPVADKLSFTSRSPDAAGYTILRSVGGALPTVFGNTTQTSGIAISAPICVPTTFSVVATQPLVNWTSDAAPPAAFLQPPSPTQTCAQAPTVKASKSALTFSLKALRHAHFKATLKLTSSGIGTATATLTGKVRKGKHTTTKTLAKIANTALAKAGSVHLKLVFPATGLRPGTYALKVVTTAPDGTHHATTTLKLEVRK